MSHATPSRLGLFALLLCLPLLTMAAPRGVALVIGNAGYVERPLKNPVNDARDLSDALKKAGFEVMLRQNLTADQMKEAIADFGDRLARERTVGLFYFSGHGMQTSKGNNYLLPVGRNYQRERDVEFYAVEARSVLSQMEGAGNPLNIVVLDACRDAPLPAEVRNAAGKGLARMDAPSGSIIAFATAPGHTASDNPDQRNGLYTKHLIAAINTPGLRLEDVFKRVGRNVERESNRQQSPEEMMKLRDDTPFFFISPALVATPTPHSVGLAAPSFSDLGLEELKQEAQRRQDWAKWQTRMLKDYEAVRGLAGASDLRLRAWERFTAGYSQDNPYSVEDESLRVLAAEMKLQVEVELANSLQVTPDGRVGLGERCNVHSECAGNLICGAGVCREMNSRPEPVQTGSSRVGFGERCNVHSECAGDLICGGGVCREMSSGPVPVQTAGYLARVGFGERCNVHSECAGDLICGGGACRLHPAAVR